MAESTKVKTFVCKNCKHIFTDKSQCPLCHSTQFTNVWRGVIFVQDHTKSDVAKHIGIHDNGKFALKVK